MSGFNFKRLAAGNGRGRPHREPYPSAEIIGAIKTTMFRRASLAALAAIVCPVIITPMAQADPQPAPICTDEVQLTPQVLAKVCKSTAVGYDHRYHSGYATIKNISAGAYDATLRVDLMEDSTVWYGSACAKVLVPGQTMFCSAPTRVDGGPYRARARIQTPGYLEYVESPKP
jgi:hypothetical protein